MRIACCMLVLVFSLISSIGVSIAQPGASNDAKDTYDAFAVSIDISHMNVPEELKPLIENAEQAREKFYNVVQNLTTIEKILTDSFDPAKAFEDSFIRLITAAKARKLKGDYIKEWESVLAAGVHYKMLLIKAHYSSKGLEENFGKVERLNVLNAAYKTTMSDFSALEEHLKVFPYKPELLEDIDSKRQSFNTRIEKFLPKSVKR